MCRGCGIPELPNASSSTMPESLHPALMTQTGLFVSHIRNMSRHRRFTGAKAGITRLVTRSLSVLLEFVSPNAMKAAVNGRHDDDKTLGIAVY